MPNSNSQEQIIYRSLAGKIQLGFFDDGTRFPCVQQVAAQYGVSYCPAQRALKALEGDGLISLCRGRETQVLAKPYGDFLASPVFRERAAALSDLTRALKLISPEIGLQGMSRLERTPAWAEAGGAPGKRLYDLFWRSLRTLGSRTALSLYYDVGSFAQSAFLDILQLRQGEEGRFPEAIYADMLCSWEACRGGRYATARERMDQVGRRFTGEVEAYLDGLPAAAEGAGEAFSWEPHKGRTRYCDVVAIDIICRINQGEYPVGALLPNVAEVADTYHISVITLRRTIAVLNKLGITRSINGVGTRVISAGDSSILGKMEELMLDENLRGFLEALQLLTMTCEAVLRQAFPHFTGEVLEELDRAAAAPGENASMVGVLTACLQAAIRCSPAAAIREIYGKLTLQLLKGSVLRLSETGEEPVPGWPACARALREALAAGDGARFARTVRLLSEENFLATKRTLLELGVSGAAEVADPLGIELE